MLAKVEQFHTDCVACAVAALATGTNAPVSCGTRRSTTPIARGELLWQCADRRARKGGARQLLGGSRAGRQRHELWLQPADRLQRGEFGHNDFYPVAVAAAQLAGWDGRRTLLAMLCLDEIRGRLAEVFGLKDHKIDHVLHGAIASAAVYGAILGATPSRSSRRSAWWWPTTCRFGRFVTASNFPTAKAPRRRSAPKSPC